MAQKQDALLLMIAPGGKHQKMVALSLAARETLASGAEALGLALHEIHERVETCRVGGVRLDAHPVQQAVEKRVCRRNHVYPLEVSAVRDVSGETLEGNSSDTARSGGGRGEIVVQRKARWRGPLARIRQGQVGAT